MSGNLDPITNPQAWDVIIIAGQTSPGFCEVGEFKRAHEWDVKKGKGVFGATTTFVGRPPAKGTIKFYLWRPSDFVAWDTFRKLLKYDPTKTTVSAVDIFHPSLADIDVKSVVTESIGNIVHEGQQMYSISVELLEYFPPPKISAVATPSTSKTGSGSSAGKNADPWNTDPQLQAAIDKQNAINAELLKKAQEP